MGKPRLGTTGFEPVNTGTKTRGLTACRRPNQRTYPSMNAPLRSSWSIATLPVFQTGCVAGVYSIAAGVYSRVACGDNCSGAALPVLWTGCVSGVMAALQVTF